jgi:hypothetical protein
MVEEMILKITQSWSSSAVDETEYGNTNQSNKKQIILKSSFY